MPNYSLLSSLLDQGVITATQYEIALYQANLTEDDPVKFILKANWLEHSKWSAYISRNYAMEYLEAEDAIAIQPDWADILGIAWIKNNLILPLYVDPEGHLIVAMAAPYADQALHILLEKINFAHPIKTSWVYYSQFQNYLKQLQNDNQVSTILCTISSDPHQLRNVIQEEQHLVVRLAYALLHEAIMLKTSDIHCDPQQHACLIRYRIDGVLRSMHYMHLHLWKALCIRYKIMANVDSTSIHTIQEGRFSFQYGDTDTDVRLSLLPGIAGEHLVLRFLSNSHKLDLQDMQLPPITQQALTNVMRQPSGLVLIAGPTGSGKSTTLYTLLNLLDYEQLNIITLEDPVEYRQTGIRQINVRSEYGMDFYNVLKAVLRQDPDVILLGEIRDAKTAELALKSSMTGHLVLATVHAGDVEGIYHRMQSLGVDSKVLIEQSLACIAQRLLRKACTVCKSKGCSQCAESGYDGRVLVLEMAHNIHHSTQLSDLTWSKRLHDSAQDLVLSECTTQTEVDRVFGGDINA